MCFAYEGQSLIEFNNKKFNSPRVMPDFKLNERLVFFSTLLLKAQETLNWFLRILLLGIYF